MSSNGQIQKLTKAVEQLSEKDSLRGLFYQHRDGNALPSGNTLEEIIDLLRAILFPGYYGRSTVHLETINYHIGVNVERLERRLTDQILAGLCFGDADEDCNCQQSAALKERARELAIEVIGKLPQIRNTLATDIEAAYNGDPAVDNYGEVIACYPVIKALTNYRFAHELHKLGVPLLPRMITELAHSETGIDIHPAATIGHHFTIDHGTGVVIGATCIIGNNVKLYQGVTLGAKSFPLDEDGNPIKGIPRHPIIEDNVIVYANATILGRITIGEGCIVGANAWVTKDMKPKTKKYKKEQINSIEEEYINGTGI